MSYATTINTWKKDLLPWSSKFLKINHLTSMLSLEGNRSKLLRKTYGRKGRYFLSTIMVQDKTNDGLNAWLYLIEIGIQQQLAPQSYGHQCVVGLLFKFQKACLNEKKSKINWLLWAIHDVMPKNVREVITGYIAKEATEFCLDYISIVESTRVPKSWPKGRCGDKGTQGVRLRAWVGRKKPTLLIFSSRCYKEKQPLNERKMDYQQAK
ncbi:hypothetical protein CR513_39079, partial [Mucuna pruriens]